jgi:sugar lactone lactonase YvrE
VARAFLVVIAIAAGACLDAKLVPCGDQLCARGDTCVADQLCASKDQLAACAGLADDGTCQLAGEVGHCSLGVCIASTWSSAALVGGNANATAVSLLLPWAVAVDTGGNLFVVETGNHRIRRVDAATGVVTTIAGNGSQGFSGDGGPATSAQFFLPRSVAVDGIGNLYIADTDNERIRKVDTSGIITTIAGNGTSGFNPLDTVAITAQLNIPYAVAVDGLGNVYIADTGNSAIRVVDPAGRIQTIAGNGTAGYTGDNGPAALAQLHLPYGVALDRAGNLFIADTGNSAIRRIAATTGTITAVAGTGTPGFTGDGGPAISAELAGPIGVSVDSAGDLYISDTANSRVREVDTAGTITTIAGGATSGFSGDGGPAANALLYYPRGIAVDERSNVYIADSVNRRIRRIDASSTITTVAGDGNKGAGDGGAATATRVSPSSVGLDSHGNVFVADTLSERVVRIDAQGILTTVAGSGTGGYAGDNGPAIEAQLDTPSDLVIDGADNIFIADTDNHRIRRVDANGNITTIAGNGTPAFLGEGSPAIDAELSRPSGLALGSDGSVYIADTGNSRVRQIDPMGLIHTVAGNGATGYVGDGVAATTTALFDAIGVAVDPGNNVVIADTNDNRIRLVQYATGQISTIAGDGTGAFLGEGVAATTAEVSIPRGVALDGSGGVYFADQYNNRVRHIDAAGIIATVAGSAMQDSSGDGGLASAASLYYPSDVAIDGTGAIYIADTSSFRVRRIDANGTIRTIAGVVDPDGVGPFDQAYLADPRALVASPLGFLFAGGNSGTIERARFDTRWIDAVAGRYPQTTATGVLARYRAKTFGDVGGIAFDPVAGRVYLTETSTNLVDVVTIVDPADAATWTFATLAGNGSAGFADGPGATAQFRGPTGLYLDATAGRLLVADTGNHVVRVIDLRTAMVSTVAGTPATRGYFGDGGSATAALLFEPRALTMCANGDVFVADSGNHRVRRIDAKLGTISTVLGDGDASSAGQGTPASAYPVNAPRGLACDANGNVYVTSTTAVRLISADDHGAVDGSGPVETIYGAPPANAFPANVTRCLTGIAVSDPANIAVTDACMGMLIAIHRQPR